MSRLICTREGNEKDSMEREFNFYISKTNYHTEVSAMIKIRGFEDVRVMIALVFVAIVTSIVLFASADALEVENGITVWMSGLVWLLVVFRVC
jgi:molybdopterin-binding protein